jgi:hypothetical protein
MENLGVENMRDIGCSASRVAGIYAKIGKLTVAHDVAPIANRAHLHPHRPLCPEHDIERRLWLQALSSVDLVLAPRKPWEDWGLPTVGTLDRVENFKTKCVSLSTREEKGEGHDTVGRDDERVLRRASSVWCACIRERIGFERNR